MSHTPTLPRMSEHLAPNASMPRTYELRAPAPGYDWACWDCAESWRSPKPNSPPPGKCPRCHSPRWWWRPKQKQVEAPEPETHWFTSRELQNKVRQMNEELRRVDALQRVAAEAVLLPPPPVFFTPPTPENQIATEPAETETLFYKAPGVPFQEVVKITGIEIPAEEPVEPTEPAPVVEQPLAVEQPQPLESNGGDPVESL